MRPLRRPLRFALWAAWAVLIAAAIAPRPALSFDAFRVPDRTIDIASTTPWSSSTNGHSAAPAAPEILLNESPVVHALRLNGTPIEVDGRLDDAAWSEAEPGYGFRVWDPDRGKTPTEETVFKVAYDDDALYFGVACHEKDPANVAKCLSRRDQIQDSDLVSVYLDPYLDKKTGYNFRVNPVGVQEDAYMYNDGERDPDWNAVWDAETTMDENGWYTEMRIPFSSIRYKPGDSMTWGLQMYRYMHRRGEDTAWTTWDKEKNGFVSRFGTVDAIAGVPAARQLEILPYVVTRFTDPSASGADDTVDDFENFGADLKYGVTADLTLNAAFQPDFGQVEADPAVLNRSPFETFYEEKRPFFVEGNRFFQNSAFDLFYSRRIGTGDESSRIRAAGKLTGKAAGNVTLALLAAATDVTSAGQSHNFMKPGDLREQFVVGRLGKDFAKGNHSFNLMQTATFRDSDRSALLDQGYGSRDADRLSRDGYTTGMDFDLNFKDRTYGIGGAFVGSIVESAPVEGIEGEPDIPEATRYGTGGELAFDKSGGSWIGNIGGRWESDQLDINDVGFMSAPDEIFSFGWLAKRYIPKDETPRWNQAQINLNLHKSWLYAGSTVTDESGDVLWAYSPGHRQSSGGNVNANVQFRSYRSAFAGVWYNDEGSDKYQTRGGPLFTMPERGGFWIGGGTDYRRRFSMSSEVEWWRDVSGTEATDLEADLRWNMSNRLSHSLALGFNDLHDDSQYIETIEHGDPSLGIGGSSYIYGELDAQTFDVTLRSNFLFSRSQSLELYMQPFLTVGDYTKAKELARPSSYDFVEYTRGGYDPNDFDDTFASVNLNMVYRWEYLPGSTLFLVWTMGNSEYSTRSDSGDPNFDPSLSADKLFSNEPENTLLAKITYWFAP
jgi:hypothetical protein